MTSYGVFHRESYAGVSKVLTHAELPTPSIPAVSASQQGACLMVLESNNYFFISGLPLRGKKDTSNMYGHSSIFLIQLNNGNS